MPGIEPSKNVSEAAAERGVPTDVSFFGEEKGREMAAAGKMADLVLGNNVLAQVPDLNDFVAGIPLILKPTGTVTIEFPHVMRLLDENQFDTIYHEHFCYFSLISAEAHLRRPRHDDLRRRGAVDPRRLAAHLRPAHRRRQPPGHRTRRSSCATREEDAGYRDVEHVHRASRSRSARRSASCSSC